MSRKTEVIVVGSGLAGLTAALACANANRKTRMISHGRGCISISPGYIDLLGYGIKGERVDNPWEAMKALPPEHPYSILGAENVKSALEELCGHLASGGYPVACARDESGNPVNTLMPTIMGTLKPTYLVQTGKEAEITRKAKKILVVSVRGFRDCKPRLIINQLKRYKDWEEKEFEPLVLPAPFDEHGRSLNALDLAHQADRPKGRDWLLKGLKDRGKNFDLALLPPMLGARASSGIRKIMEETLGCPWVEMISLPPGVSGLRIRDALVNELVEKGVEIVENSEVIGVEVSDGKCVSLATHSSGREITQSADAYVIATGGILGGGTILGPGQAKEGIFGLEIPVPENVDEWSSPEIFGKHLVSSLGVKVDGGMRALDKDGNPCLSNVFFAGRTIGGYDYASEKSGHGVAAATGWMAGRMASQCAAKSAGSSSEKAEVAQS